MAKSSFFFNSYLFPSSIQTVENKTNLILSSCLSNRRKKEIFGSRVEFRWSNIVCFPPVQPEQRKFICFIGNHDKTGSFAMHATILIGQVNQ